MPERPRELTRGCFPELDTPEARLGTIQLLEEEVHSTAQQRVLKYKTATIEKALGLWRLEVFPPTQEQVTCLGAVLKAGRYRSADSYLGLYKALSLRRGFKWDSLLQKNAAGRRYKLLARYRRPCQGPGPTVLKA